MMMMMLEAMLLSLAQPVNAEAICKADEYARTTKTLVNLQIPVDTEDPAIGDVTRVEHETYGSDGRRQRVEWRDPDGTVTLAFMELYGDAEKPYGALYVTDGAIEPTREAFIWSDDGRRKSVEYRNPAGEVTGRSLFLLDAQDREIERRYGVDGDTFASSDRVTWEGKNEARYVWSAADGSRSSTVDYQNLKIDEKGNWVLRRSLRNGTPTVMEIRTLTYRDCS